MHFCSFKSFCLCVVVVVVVVVVVDSPRKHVYLLNSALEGLLILKGFKFQRNWLILSKLS